MEAKFMPGPWMIATSNSWRRIVGARGELVCEPIVQRTDNHPDLHFRNGGPDGPDARLIAAAPDLFEALADAEGAIASLEPDDFGGIYDGHGQQVGTVRDQLLAKIRAALSKAANASDERSPQAVSAEN